MNGETWIICGGRAFRDYHGLCRCMSDLVARAGCPARVVHGDARGADKMAGEWGRSMSITVVPVRAEWAKEGQAAGVLRNQRMLDLYQPALVVAFPGGVGTRDMVRRAQRAGVKVAEVSSPY